MKLPQSTRSSIQVVKMSEPVAEVLPPAYPHLPEDLWLHIASLLSTKEWVGASGTCKALHQMPLEHISIVSDLTEGSGATSALLWMASHLCGARTIVMNGWPMRSSVSQEDLSAVCSALQSALEASALAPSSLADLSLRGTPWGYDMQGKVRAHIYLSRILQGATNLRRLNIVCGEFPALPPMANLKHLYLRLDHEWLPKKRLSQVLLSMPSLETLHLCRHPQLPYPWYLRQARGLHDPALEVPEWVQHLELGYVFPRHLKLKSSNTRVILCGALRGLKNALNHWPDVRGQVKGVWILNIDDYRYRNGSKLWDNIEVLNFMEEEIENIEDSIIHGTWGF